MVDARDPTGREIKYFSIEEKMMGYNAWNELSFDLWKANVLSQGKPTNTERGNILLLVHGGNTNKNENIRWHKNIQKRLQNDHGYNGAVVSFNWPSFKESDIIVGKANAGNAARPFVEEVINKICTSPDDCTVNIDILAFSLGTNLVKAALTNFSPNIKVNQIYFVASAIEQSDGEVTEFLNSERYFHLANYYSSKDIFLSNVLNGSSFIGNDGLPTLAKPTNADIDCSEYHDSTVKDNWLERLLRPLLNPGKHHDWYFKHKAFYENLETRLPRVENFDGIRPLEIPVVVGGNFTLQPAQS